MSTPYGVVVIGAGASASGHLAAIRAARPRWRVVHGHPIQRAAAS